MNLMQLNDRQIIEKIEELDSYIRGGGSIEIVAFRIQEINIYLSELQRRSSLKYASASYYISIAAILVALVIGATQIYVSTLYPN